MKGSDSRSLYAIQRLGKIMIGVTEQLIDKNNTMPNKVARALELYNTIINASDKNM